jgi:ABC-type multidrug transport system ATPase subunit
MNQGRLLASGSADEVREKLGSTKRLITATPLSRHEDAVAWLSTRMDVRDVRAEADRVVFAFSGNDEAQADLIEGLISTGIRLRSFEEKRSSFEDILVEVAETNRNS